MTAGKLSKLIRHYLICSCSDSVMYVWRFTAIGVITGNLYLHRKEEERPSFAGSGKCRANLRAACEIDAPVVNINHNEQIEMPTKRHLDCCADMRPNWLPLVHYYYQAVVCEVELLLSYLQFITEYCVTTQWSCSIF